MPLAHDATLRCPTIRLAAGIPTTIAFFGSSITMGHKNQGSFTGLIKPSLAAKMQSTNVTVATHGYPGATPMFLAACVHRMVPTRADIYVVESVDNMMPESAWPEARDAVESIVTALRARSPKAAVLLLAPFPVSCTRLLRKQLRENGDLLAAARKCLRPDYSLAGMLEGIAQAARVPIVSVRQELAVPLLAHAASRNGTLGPWLDSFVAGDDVHPNLPGRHLLAKLVVDALVTAAAGRGARSCWRLLPPATQNRSASSSHVYGAFAKETNAVCAFGEELRPLIRRSEGWHHVVERSEHTNHSKPGFVARRPGSTIDFCFAPPVAAVKRKETMEWTAVYLQSYRHMGAVQAGCIEGCTCAVRTWDAHITRRVSQSVLGKLKRVRVQEERAGDACPCVIRLKVLDATESGEHKFKLVGVLTGFYAYRGVLYV